MAIQRTGPSGSGRYLTVPSRVSLSIRRNLSNIACGDLSLVLLDDASRWTVARAEVHSGACLLAAARAFHQNMLAEIAEKPSSGFDDSKGLSQPAVCIHSISQDATNSAIWQKRKLSALILESAFCPSLPSKEDLGASGIELANVFQMMQCVADCQPVGDSSAAGTVALTHKMLGSLGCPSVQSLLESPLAEKGSTSGHFSTGSVHAYIMTTDRGPNEVLARKMWNVLAKDAPHILFFTNDCFEHAIHLITLSSLKTIDGLLRRFGKGFKFFSSLATASNTLRDVSKALFEKWCEIHGDKSGMQHAKKLWPKAVGGRNSITEVEQRMLDIGGMSMMLPVLLEVLKKKDKDKDNKKDLPPNDDVVDEISFDATKQYQRNMGAWRKKTLECAQDPLWWVLSETMRLAQSPGTHVSAFLKVTLSDQELEQKGQTIAQLVDGRSESFLEEFSGIFHSSAGQISNHPDWPELSSGEKQFILNTLALMLFQNASGFQRRIHSQVQSFPLVILSMGRVRYDLPCMRRQELAKTMLQEATTTNTVLDVNTLKVIRMFKQDISMASENGQIGFGFFVFIKALRRLWRGDVRENERLNKQLKLYGSRAPNSSLELISSRLCLKFKLGARGFNESRHPLTKKPSKSVTRNWSNVRSLASSVFDDCMEHWVVGASEVLSQDKRFAEVSPEPWCPTRKEVHKWTPLLFGGCKPTAATATATAGSDSVEQGNLKRSQVIAAAVNRTLSRFLTSGSDPSKTAASAAAPESHGPAPGQPEQLPPLPFPEHMFSAVSLVPGSVDKNRPYRLPTGATLYIFCEIVNRSVRFLEATWTGSRIAVKQPWTFRWAVDLILQAHGAMKAGDPPILVMAFPIAWMLAESTAGVGLEGSCVSRTGSVPFVTVTHWEEVCILQKAGIKRMDPRVQVNKPPPSSSDIDDGSDSGSSRSSSDSKHQANQPATTKPSKPAPAGKPEPKRRPRKQPADDEVVQIGWLSELFNELQPGEAEESSVTVVNASDSETESAKTKPLVEKAQALVEEAFGPTNNMSLDQDEIEIQEDDFTKEVISESGLDVMAVREQQILEKACEEFASSTEFTAKESVFLEDNLADSIAELVQQGASPEDAAEELMLSHLIGNGIEEPRKPEASASSFSAASSSVPSFAAPSSHHLSTALSTWLQECVISLRALQLRGKAVSEKTVGQQSELSLVYGHVKGDADQSESPSIFWVHWRDASQRWGRPASLDQNCRVKCIVATGSLRDPRDYTSTTIIHPAVGARMERVRGYAGGQRPKVPDDVMRVHSICQRALVARDEQEQLHISLQNPGESSFSKFLKSAPDSTECCFICQQHRCPRMGPEDRDSNSDSLAPVLVLCPICLLPSHPGCCQAVATYAKGDEDEDDVSAMSVSFPSDIQLDAIDLPLSHLFEPQSRRSILCPLCAAFAFPDLAGGADHGHQEEEADGRNEDEGEREGNHGQPAGENIPADVGRPAIAAAAGVKELA